MLEKEWQIGKERVREREKTFLNSTFGLINKWLRLAEGQIYREINTNSFGSLNIWYDGPQIYAVFLMALLGVDTSILKVLHGFLLENQHEASEFFCPENVICCSDAFESC